MNVSALIITTVMIMMISTTQWIYAAGTNTNSDETSDQEGLDDFTADESTDVDSAIHATRLKYSKFDVPEAVTVITQQQIVERGILDVSEIFRSVPGFRIVKIGDETRTSYHGTAARQNRRLKVTVNGKSVLHADGAYVEFDRLPFDIDDIETVTILRGPNGASFGDNAFFASINFVLKPAADRNKVGAIIGRGDHDNEQLSFYWNPKIGSTHIATAITQKKDGGYAFRDAMGSPRPDGQELKRARVSIEHQSNNGSGWVLDASYLDSEHLIGFPSIGWNGKQTNDATYVSLDRNHHIDDNTRLDWMISFNNQRERLRVEGCFSENLFTTIKDNTSVDNHPQLDAAATFIPIVLGVAFEDVCGFTQVSENADRYEAELEYEAKRGKLNYLLGGSLGFAEAKSADFFIDKETQTTYRAFGEASYRLPAWTLSAGAMVQDSDNVESTEFAWRTTANYHAGNNHHFRVSVTDSFRIPSLVETETNWSGSVFVGARDSGVFDLALPFPVVTNPNTVQVEQICSYSLGYFGTFMNNRVKVDAKLFHNTIVHPVESGTIHFTGPPINREGYELKGGEVDISVQLTPEVYTQASYSYLDNSTTRTFERSLHGDHAGSISTVYRIDDEATLSLSYYGNSSISNNTYDRFDLAYAIKRRLKNGILDVQIVFQKHIGGVDGIGSTDPRTNDEGYFKFTNQMFVKINYGL